MSYNLVKMNDPILKQKCDDVTEFNDKLEYITKRMTSIMKSKGGIGLAAPQIGISKNIIIVKMTEGFVVEMINPKITWTSQTKIVGKEGCLSFPGMYMDVARWNVVEVEWLNLRGFKCKDRFGGRNAIVAQHEIDHINGVAII